jgi:hypothetical protein
MQHIFAKPYTFEGTEYSEVEIDLDGLTGADLSVAKREWAAPGNFSPIPSTDMDFCASVAARAAKKPLEFFTGLPAKEYAKITQAVSNFLLA